MDGDVVERLRGDHQRIRAIIEELRETPDGAVTARKEGLVRLRRELIPHFKAEERLYYPELERDGAVLPSVIDARHDHEVAKAFLDDLDEIDARNGAWAAGLLALREMVEHHFDQEEGAFPGEGKLHDE